MKHVLLTRNLFRFTLLLLSFMLISVIIMAQVTISGKVTGGRNATLTNASVTLRGTALGTSTDDQGNYTLTVEVKPGKYTLEFSGIGYKTKTVSIDIGSANSYTVNASLDDDIIGMDEVVVTGTLGRSSKRQLGNSISTVSARQLQNSGASNLSAILSGRVMGAQVNQNSGDPGGGISIKLRGVGSITGSSEPLYIVDGVIIDNSSANVVNLNADAQGSRIQAGTNRIADINPNDIERIEVINGAAAAAIYGSRASNGVVQIFTKRGRSGKPRVTLTTSVQHNSLRKRWEMNDVPRRFGYAGDTRLSTVGDRLTTIANLRSNQATVPGTGPAALGGRLDQNTYNVTRYDYQDIIFNSSVGTDNHLSVSGGTDKASYYFSTSYLLNNGIISNTNFQRYGFKVRTDFTLSSWAKISGGTMYTNSRSKDMPNGNNFFSPISTMTIIDNVWNAEEKDANGKLQHVERLRVNPLTVLETFDIRQETNRNISDVKLTLTPIKGVTIDLTNGFDTYAQEGNTFQERMPYEPLVAATFFPDGYASYARLNYFQWTGDYLASYKTDFTNKISSNTTAGFTAQYIKTSFASQEGRDLLPNVKTIRAAQNLFSLPTDTRTQQSIWGYFLQQTLAYDNKLFLTLAGRFDGSSAFGADVRNIFYPKASLSYNLSDEKFWENSSISKWLNTIKLRASYGKAGNLTGISAYERFTVYSPISYTGGGFAPLNRIGNAGVRPEIKEEIEGGFDALFFNGKLGLQFTYYNQNISDLLLPFNLAPSNGAGSILDNVGKMRNRGFEMMLTGSPVRNNNFKWDASLLFTRNKNEVTEVYRNATFIGFDASNTQGVLLGQPVGVYYVNYFATKNDGSLLLRDVNGFLLPQVERGDPNTNTPQRDANGQPTGTPLRKVLGDPNPDFILTLNNEFTFKNFSVRMQWDGVYGFEVYNWDWITRNNVGNGPNAAKELKGELPRGWVAAIGGFIGPRIQEEHVENGSFTKLRELALGYTFNKVKFAQSMKVTLVGRNLLSIDKYRGFDPEINSAGQSIVRGTDFGSFPIPRTIQLSIITNF
jgi:TonB-linked SusC/RagA family outer membrane protein